MGVTGPCGHWALGSQGFRYGLWAIGLQGLGVPRLSSPEALGSRGLGSCCHKVRAFRLQGLGVVGS